MRRPGEPRRYWIDPGRRSALRLELVVAEEVHEAEVVVGLPRRRRAAPACSSSCCAAAPPRSPPAPGRGSARASMNGSYTTLQNVPAPPVTCPQQVDRHARPPVARGRGALAAGAGHALQAVFEVVRLDLVAGATEAVSHLHQRRSARARSRATGSAPSRSSEASEKRFCVAGAVVELAHEVLQHQPPVVAAGAQRLPRASAGSAGGRRGPRGTCPRPPSRRRSRLRGGDHAHVHAPGAASRPPAGSRPRSSARSSIACAAGESSPTSSSITTPPSASSNTPRWSVTAPVKAAAAVAEQLAGDQLPVAVLRAVHRDERALAAPAAEQVDGLREQLLARFPSRPTPARARRPARSASTFSSACDQRRVAADEGGGPCARPTARPRASGCASTAPSGPCRWKPGASTWRP